MCFEGTGKLENWFPRLPKSTRIRVRKLQKTSLVKSWFLQYLPCENLDFGCPKLEISTQKSRKKPSRIEPEKNEVLSALDSKSSYKQVPESPQNRWKSCSGPLRVRPAALMGLQGGPEVAKWPSRVLPRCQNGCPDHQNRETKPPSNPFRSRNLTQPLPKMGRSRRGASLARYSAFMQNGAAYQKWRGAEKEQAAAPCLARFIWWAFWYWASAGCVCALHRKS